MPAPTVFVVDDDNAILEIVSRIVEQVGLCAEVYSSPGAFLSAYDPRRPGCLVADVKMPGMTGVELQEALQASGAVLPVIIISGNADVPITVRAMKAAAIDVLEKPFAPHELLVRIQQALELDRRRRSEQLRQAELSEKFSELTARESQVLQLVIAGLANKQMARRLDLSEKTIEGHRSRLMKRIGVQSVAELVRLAMDSGVAREPAE